MTTQKKTTIGGQAIIEGIVMKGPKKSCTVVRRANGELVSKTEPTPSRAPIWEKPIFRGAYTLFTAMKEGMQAINYSASFFEDEEADVPPSRFELWLEKKFGSEGLNKVILSISTVIGIALPIGLFILLPSFLGGFVPKTWGVLARNVLEGCVRVVLFLLFMWSVSHMKDIRRTFEYHGAEHKSILCYESGAELTVENVRRCRRFHPRCGTSFIFVVMILSIIVFSFVTWDTLWLRLLLKLPLLPLIAGVGFEFLIYAGKHDNLLTKIATAPGMWMQRLTTREPDDAQIEIGITALQGALADEFPDLQMEAVPDMKDTYQVVFLHPTENGTNRDDT